MDTHFSANAPAAHPFGARAIVVHLGEPGARIVEKLGRAQIAFETAANLGEITTLANAASSTTILVPVDRWAQVAGRTGAARVIVVTEADDFDRAYDALAEGADDVVDAEDTAGDLGDLIYPTRARPVGDGSSVMHTPRLAELSAEVAKIARALDGLAQSEPAAAPGVSAELRVNAQQVRALIRARRARTQYFPSDLFADPAWDILLDLMASRLEGRTVSVSSLCIAAAVPATTALRWIKSMTDADLLARKPDPLDGRRVFIDLTERAVEAMNAYMASSRGIVAV